MNFLIACLFSFSFMIVPIHAQELPDLETIKINFKALHDQITQQNVSSLHSDIQKKHTIIIERIETKIGYIDNILAKNVSDDCYLEDLLERRLQGWCEYIVAYNKTLHGKISLESIAGQSVMFSPVDQANYFLSTQLIKAIYQQTVLSNLSEKTRNYLNMSKTLWDYLQGKSTVPPTPTIGGVWEDASLYTRYVKEYVVPNDIFPVLKK